MTHLTSTLDEVCEFIVDCLHATAPTQDAGYPLIRTPNIGKGRLSLEKAYRVSDETYQKWTRRAVPEPGDLILAREALAGNVALVQSGQEVCLGQRTVHLRPDKTKVDPAFLCYYLLAPSQQAALLAGETGATAKHINMKDIRRLPLVNLPHLDTQVKVGEMLAGYDDLIENNKRRIQLLEESARLLYMEWFVHLRFPGHEHVKVTNGLPEGWEPLPLGDLITLQRGFDLPVSKRVEGEVPIYASTGITGYHTEAKVSGPGVVTGRSGSLGQVMYVSSDYWPLNTTLWVKEFKKIRPHFSRHLLAGLHLEQYNGGAAVPTLNRNDVHRIQVLLPPPMLLSLFEEQAMNFYQQVDVLTRTNERLAKARDLLLPKLMSGELVA